MKSILSIFILVLSISCCPNFKKEISVTKNINTDEIWIKYYGTKKDTLAINWLLSYQINNKTNGTVKIDWIRKRPEYLWQSDLMKITDSISMYNSSIYKNKSRELLLFCSKVVSVKDFPNNYLDKMNLMFTSNQSEINISNVLNEQIKFKDSQYFKNILKEIQNDSIAIVFRDSVCGDYFQFKGVIEDKELKFSQQLDKYSHK